MEIMYRTIDVILPPPAPHMVGDGFRVHNFFPHYSKIGMQGMSPFFLLDYNSKVVIPPSEIPKGVGVHPHRGFETVTIAYKGKVAHHDSAGNSGVIGEGDVQWMTAGSGILHKEYHEKVFSKNGGPFQMVQLWVNLPSKYKMTKPKYQGIENNSMSKYYLENGKGVIEIIAGNFKGIKGSANTFTPVNLLNAKLAAGTGTDFTFPEQFNTGLLVIEGDIKVNGTKQVSQDNFVLFKHEGETFIIEALKDSIVLILSGEAIDEPIESSGPFLMNTKAEIEAAFDDYYSGKFGFLDE
jgi:quercetin 2,3-dioxygenase